MYRFVLLLISASLVGADPVLRPYPDAPLLSLTVADVVGLRAHLAASWYGALGSQAGAAPVRRRLAELVAEGERLTGIGLGDLGDHLRGLQLTIAQTVSLRLDLDQPAAPLLVGVAAAAERDRRAAEQQFVAIKDFYRRQRLGLAEGAAPAWPLPWVPAQAAAEGIVIARSRNQGTIPGDDGLVVVPRGAALLCGVATPSQGAAPVATPGVDLSLSADLPAWADATGIPGLGEALRLAGVGHATGTVVVTDAGSRETLLIPGARMPLRPVDAAVLEVEVPADALALSAIGVDGPALAALARRVAGVDPALADLSAVSEAALRDVDGTLWMAVLPGFPMPDVAVAIPAGPAVDAWLHALLPDDGAILDAAHGREVTLIPSWPGMTLALRRTPRAWLIATDVGLLDHLGSPGLAERLSTVHGIPKTALALALQANQPILRRLSAYAAFAQMALSVGAATGNTAEGFPPWSASDVRMAVSALQRMGGAATAPTTIAWLDAEGDGLALHGRDLVLGIGVLPTAAVFAAGLLPFVAPAWSHDHHPLVVAQLMSDVVSVSTINYLLVNRAESGHLPGATRQLMALARASPFMAMREQALELLAKTVPLDGFDAALPWWRAGLADARGEIRHGAARGLGVALNRFAVQQESPPPALVALMIHALGDADVRLRTAAAQSLAPTTHLLRAQPGVEVKLPTALLEALVTLTRDERHPEALGPLLTALAVFNDQRIPAILRKALDHADAGVRAHAAQGLGFLSTTAQDDQTVARLAQLRADPAPIPDYPYTVGNSARAALYGVQGAAATAAIAAELDGPTPPTVGPAWWPVDGDAWAVQTVAALVRRDHAPALARAATMVDRAFISSAAEALDMNQFMPLVQALATTNAPAAEPLLTRLLGSPDREVAAVAAVGLGHQAQLHPLAAASIAALTRALTLEVFWGRVVARRALDLATLSDQQRFEVTVQIAHAEAKFGTDAFVGYQPPKPPEPTAPAIKPGANDF